MNTNKTKTFSMFLIIAVILVAGTISITIPSTYAQDPGIPQTNNAVPDTSSKDLSGTQLNCFNINQNNINIVPNVDSANDVTGPLGLETPLQDEPIKEMNKDDRMGKDKSFSSASIVNMCQNNNLPIISYGPAQVNAINQGALDDGINTIERQSNGMIIGDTNTLVIGDTNTQLE